jgi:hypothetical protein
VYEVLFYNIADDKRILHVHKKPPVKESGGKNMKTMKTPSKERAARLASMPPQEYENLNASVNIISRIFTKF